MRLIKKKEVIKLSSPQKLGTKMKIIKKILLVLTSGMVLLLLTFIVLNEEISDILINANVSKLNASADRLLPILIEDGKEVLNNPIFKKNDRKADATGVIDVFLPSIKTGECLQIL